VCSLEITIGSRASSLQQSRSNQFSTSDHQLRKRAQELVKELPRGDGERRASDGVVQEEAVAV
jgi:hypothetical protein